MHLRPKSLVFVACMTITASACGGSTDDSAADRPPDPTVPDASTPPATAPPASTPPATAPDPPPTTTIAATPDTAPTTTVAEAPDPAPTTTPPPTTSDSTTTEPGPDAETSVSTIVPPGEFAVGPGDLVVLRTDGDLELRPDAIARGAEADAIPLVDNADPRVEVTEGPGPNGIDDVAGVFDGSLVFGDCCEPVSGNIFALSAVGDERIPVGFGFSPNLSPNGTKLATGNSFALVVDDLQTGEALSAQVNDDPDQGFVDIADLEWIDDDRLIMLRTTDDIVELVVVDASTLVSTNEVELSGLTSPGRVRFAGRTFDGLIGVAVTGPGRSEVRYFDPEGLEEVTEAAQQFPADVSFVEIDGGGLGQLWVDDNELFFLATGELVARSLGDEVIAAWFVGVP